MKPRVVNGVESDKKFEFDNAFKETFNAMVAVYSKSIDKLNKISKADSIKSEYGVCSCSYKLRFITPNDVSTYVSNLIKALDNDMFHDRTGDAEMFTVASVKRFIEANGCSPFESSSVLDDAHRYVNPKEQTLHDLALISENDTGEVAVYSRGEMVKRLELMNKDVKIMNDMHFTANIKQIVNSLPGIIRKSDCGYCLSNNIYRLVFTQMIEEFILFACTLNTIAVLQLIGYGSPSVEYSTKPKDGNNDSDVVTECCLLKTNDYMLRNRMPFNCNMRDAVLQDVTPDFKDTHDTLHFIMKDARSPISILVNKYATKEAGTEFDCGIVTRLFTGIEPYRSDDGMWFDKKGNQIDNSPYNVNGFTHEPGWIDNIAYGNNYLDGNYRRDAVGNNHVNPITNSMDMLYKVFGGCDLKTNEDVANNIVRVACLMRGLIHNYRDNRIENYDLTKDILTMLGEILTRNMLRLYYNNTRVYAYTDDMPDAAAPGFICMESFIMEADANNGNQPQQNTAGNNANNTPGNNNAQTPKVTFTQNGQQQKTAVNVKLSTMLQKFIQWVRTQLSKFSENFNKNHKKEIDWINANMALNKEIEESIRKGTFEPNVSNLPKFNIKVNELKNMANMVTLVNTMASATENINMDDMLYKSSGLNDANVSELRSVSRKDQKAATEAYVNFVLFGSFKPEMINGKLKHEQWTAIYEDLVTVPKAIAEINKAIVDDINKATDIVQKKLQELETVPDDKKDNNKIELYKNIAKVIQDATRQWKVPMLNSMNNKFYSTNYTIYREIVAGYKQQSKNNAQPGITNTNNNNVVNNTENVNNSEPSLDTGSTQQNGGQSNVKTN